jgi:hypothetical protein
MRTSLRAALLVLAAGLAPSVFAQGQPEGAPGIPPEERTQVFAGAGLGGGFGARSKTNGRTVTFDDQLQGATDKTPLVAIKLASFGIALKPGLFAGIDLSGIGQSGKVGGNNTHLQITNYFAALTYFPWETGLFLRGGAGLSTFVQTTNVSGSQTTERSGGLGFLVAAGYALQLTGAHHLTLTVEQTWQSYGGSSATKPSSSQAGAAYLGYMWRP